jgi:hypothetical protein
MATRESGGKRMNQAGFPELELAAKQKRTRRERFLDQIEAATPWTLLAEQIEPFYAKSKGSLPPIRDRADVAHVHRAAVRWMG